MKKLQKKNAFLRTIESYANMCNCACQRLPCDCALGCYCSCVEEGISYSAGSIALLWNTTSAVSGSTSAVTTSNVHFQGVSA